MSKRWGFRQLVLAQLVLITSAAVVPGFGAIAGAAPRHAARPPGVFGVQTPFKTRSTELPAISPLFQERRKSPGVRLKIFDRSA